MINRIITFNGQQYRVKNFGITDGGDTLLTVEPYNFKPINAKLLLEKLLDNNIGLYHAIYQWWISSIDEVKFYNNYMFNPVKSNGAEIVRKLIEVDNRQPIDILNVLNHIITNKYWLNVVYDINVLRKKRGGIQVFDHIANSLKNTKGTISYATKDINQQSFKIEL